MIFLTVDLWTNLILKDFIALTAAVQSAAGREIFVLAISPLPGNHTAESLKKEIEKLINTYTFHKSKINGIDLICIYFEIHLINIEISTAINNPTILDRRSYHHK